MAGHEILNLGIVVRVHMGVPSYEPEAQLERAAVS